MPPAAPLKREIVIQSRSWPTAPARVSDLLGIWDGPFRPDLEALANTMRPLKPRTRQCLFMNALSRARGGHVYNCEFSALDPVVQALRGVLAAAFRRGTPTLSAAEAMDLVNQVADSWFIAELAGPLLLAQAGLLASAADNELGTEQAADD